MKYKAYLKQDGQGCDYTIGCGNQMAELYSDNLLDATKEITKMIFDWHSSGDFEIATAELYEISKVIEIDVETIKLEKTVHSRKLTDILTKENELKELERLKKKYDRI